MQKISSGEIVRIVGSKSEVTAIEISGVSTDSRNCSAGDVFIAIGGENFDGHDFALRAMEKGCPLVIVNRVLAGIPPERQIVVDDTLAAYGKIGAYNRSRFKGKVIGLTGSAGKTTTKEELKAALSLFGRVYATSGNHNNLIGVPETLCNLDMSADFAVIEMGMSAKGEISRLTSYTRPDIAVVTNVYPMHIEFFNDFREIAEAKAEIFEGLDINGTAVINADSEFSQLLAARAAEHAGRVLKFGQNFQPDFPIETFTSGRHMLYNAWCVLKVVEALGLSVRQAAAAVKNFEPLDGRGRRHVLRLPDGGEYMLIDDSYSGQPEAVKLALETLAAEPAGSGQLRGRKIAVLGKMAELGKYSKARHIEIGKAAAAAAPDIVIGVCPEMKDMLAQLPPGIERYYFEDKNPVAGFLLKNLLQKGDIVLIKGARYSSKLYQVAEELIQKGKF